MRPNRAEHRPAATPQRGAQHELFDPQAQRVVIPAQPRAAAGAVQHFDDGVHRFDWRLHRGARRTLALRIDDRGVNLLAPQHASASAIALFVRHHAAWVTSKLREREQRLIALQSARIDWADGGGFPYLGQQLTLRLCGAPQLRFDPARGALHLPLPPGSDAQRMRECVAAWMQQQARELFESRVAHYAARLGVRVAAVRLSAASTRWGSAKSDGSIRLHWRLLHFRRQLIDYVVAHEVAHLREMNHSPRFWAHVASLYPDYALARSELRQAVLPPWD